MGATASPEPQSRGPSWLCRLLCRLLCWLHREGARGVARCGQPMASLTASLPAQLLSLLAPLACTPRLPTPRSPSPQPPALPRPPQSPPAARLPRSARRLMPTRPDSPETSQTEGLREAPSSACTRSWPLTPAPTAAHAGTSPSALATGATPGAVCSGCPGNRSGDRSRDRRAEPAAAGWPSMPHELGLPVGPWRPGQGGRRDGHCLTGFSGGTHVEVWRGKGPAGGLEA